MKKKYQKKHMCFFEESCLSSKKKTALFHVGKKNREKIQCWKHCSNFTMFCDERYSASPHDLALFVMTCNYNLNQLNIKKIK